MSCPYIPKEIKGEILNHLIEDLKPSDYTRENVKKWGREISNLSAVNKEFQSLCKIHRVNAKKIHDLLNIYSKYQMVYEDEFNPNSTCRAF